jgi:hypothetical protein
VCEDQRRGVGGVGGLSGGEGISSDRQFLGLVGYRLQGWFPHVPEQSQYNRRLRSPTGLLTVV